MHQMSSEGRASFPGVNAERMQGACKQMPASWRLLLRLAWLELQGFARFVELRHTLRHLAGAPAQLGSAALFDGARCWLMIEGDAATIQRIEAELSSWMQRVRASFDFEVQAPEQHTAAIVDGERYLRQGEHLTAYADVDAATMEAPMPDIADPAATLHFIDCLSNADRI